MLRRKPTRIELKPEDIEDYDKFVKERAEQRSQQPAPASTPGHASGSASKPKPSDRK